MERCIDCFKSKKKVYFDIDKVRRLAKAAALSAEKTFCIYKEKNALCYTDLDSAPEGAEIVEMISKFDNVQSKTE